MREQLRGVLLAVDLIRDEEELARARVHQGMGVGRDRATGEVRMRFQGGHIRHHDHVGGFGAKAGEDTLEHGMHLGHGEVLVVGLRRPAAQERLPFRAFALLGQAVQGAILALIEAVERSQRRGIRKALHVLDGGELTEGG